MTRSGSLKRVDRFQCHLALWVMEDWSAGYHRGPGEATAIRYEYETILMAEILLQLHSAKRGSLFYGVCYYSKTAALIRERKSGL